MKMRVSKIEVCATPKEKKLRAIMRDHLRIHYGSNCDNMNGGNKGRKEDRISVRVKLKMLILKMIDIQG